MSEKRWQAGRWIDCDDRNEQINCQGFCSVCKRSTESDVVVVETTGMEVWEFLHYSCDIPEDEITNRFGNQKVRVTIEKCP